MKIAIDARMLSWTGIGRYTDRLLRELQDIDHDNDYLVLLQNKDFEQWEPKASNFTKVRADFEPYSLKGLFMFGPFLRKLNADLIHFTSQNTPFLFPKNAISTVHDLTLVEYKNVRGNALVYELKYRLFRLMIAGSIKRSRHLITPSEYGKQQLVHRFGRDAQTIAVTHLAADPLLAKPESIDRLHINAPYLLYVGNAYPYKNLGRLVEAFAKVREQRPGYKLVLVGKKEYFYDQLQRTIGQAGLADSVILAGFVSDGELATLYQQATLLVFPSLSEGFGLPALEAMAQGTPVIAARATSLPETCGDAAQYFEPLDVDDMAEKITALLNDKKRLAELQKLGPERVKQFSWRKMATKTVEIYKSIKF